ncbi:MAG TPA: penicillin-binding protein 2 [Limnochordales bacterium]
MMRRHPPSVDGRHPEEMQPRLVRLSAVMAVALVVLAARLWHVQIMEGARFVAMADRNHIRVVPVSAPRGRIYDRQGNELARNRLSFTLSVLPEAVDGSVEDLLARLSAILDIPQAELAERWSQATRRYSFEPVRLLRDMTLAQMVAVQEHRSQLAGIFVEEEPVRQYPEGALAAHVLGRIAPITAEELQRLSDQGYQGTDLIGAAGVERHYERYLRGSRGYREIEVDALGRFRRLVSEQPPTPGLDLHLTLDLELQRRTEEALVLGIQRAERSRQTSTDPQVRAARPVQAGAAVVLAPATGEILAMASFPGFDPERLLPWAPDRQAYFALLERDPAAPFLNRATMGTYQPGSVFKLVTAVAALEERVFAPGERFYVDGLAPYGKQDWMIRVGIAPPGLIDLVAGFEWSSNDFFWELGLRVGVDRLATWARRFGFGRSAGIDLEPGDRPGLVPDRQWKRQQFRNRPPWEQNWYEAETMDMAIGQGFLTVTPLQVALSYAAVANDGVVYRPHLVAKVTTPDGAVVWENERTVLLQVPASARTWRLVRQGLDAVVNGPHGTARGRFDGVPVRVGGKTGTAQVQAGEQSHAWFAAVAPIDDPQVVVVVVVEHGGGGASVAAPIAADILKAYFELHPVGQERA